MSICDEHRLRSVFLSCVFLVLLCFGPGVAQAGAQDFSASVPDRYTLPISERFDTRFSHYAEQQPLVDVLETFARTQGLRAAFTPHVKGEVSGRFDDMQPDEFLAAVYSAFGVEWYLMDDVVHFYVRRDLQRRMVYLTACQPSRMRDILMGAGLLSPQLPCVADDEGKVLTFSGPAEYANGIATAISSYEASFRNDQVVKVFFLKHAWAADTSVGAGEAKTSIPGVATILSQMVLDTRLDDTQLAVGTGQGAAVRETIPPLPEEQSLLQAGDMQERDSALKRLRQKAKEQMDLDRRVEAPMNTEAKALPGAAQNMLEPKILADSRSNAVIVRDSAFRMPYYEKTIEELDKPLQLVELHAAIVDVNVDYTRSLGVQWGGKGGTDRSSTGAGGNMDSPVPGLGSLPASLTGSGLTLSTVYSYGADYFMAQMEALESKGKGRVLGEPSVLTIDNTSARLESTTTFYVRIVGEKVVDLQEVSSGTILQVTPHIIYYDDKPSQIKLAVTIEDGKEPSTGDTDSDIPATTTKTVIDTQGIVGAGQSLLIGGYFYEQVSDNESGVPVLMDVPVLGHLFKTKTKTISRMERLILLSPRLLTLDGPSNVPENIDQLGFSAKPTDTAYTVPETYTEIPRVTGGGCTRASGTSESSADGRGER
ncbi:type III secretion system outer membrane ring subunit SctC [Desulfocurvus sp. DL9XJH121]